MITLDMRVCTGCKEERPATLEFFNKNGKYLSGSCKTCKMAKEKARYLANPEKAIARNKAYDLANPKKVAARKQKYRQTNSDKINKVRKIWRDSNPEKANSWHRKRRALQLGNVFKIVTNAEIFESYGTNCYLCDMPINFDVSGKVGSNPQWRSGLHIEHFVANVNGGPTTLENLRPSHAWCNLSKGIK